jgi:HEAT repeat protein
VRGQALFWLAQKAGRRAAAAIRDAINDDPETEVKRRAVFALSQLPKEEGIPQLIQVARTNRNPAVRKQAVFWLGQSNDPRALAFFEELLLKP